MKTMKVFIGPIEIAGYYANLAICLRGIGIDCDYYTYRPHPFGYTKQTEVPILLKLANFFNHFLSKLEYPYVLRALTGLMGQVLQNAWGFYAIFKYDVFIFGFGETLLIRNADLFILKVLKKTVISNLAHGSDARPPYIDGGYQSSDGSLRPTIDQLISLSKSKLKKISFIEQYSDVVLGSPLSTAHFSSRRFVNAFALGVPISLRNPNALFPKCSASESCAESQRGTRILHSPSHPAAKGSSLIRQAISNLQCKGYTIELVLLQSRPHSDVIREIQQCDFVVDQVYSDTPIAGFVTEAACFGKPAVVGGYGFDYLKTLVPEDMWPPVKTCQPDEIEHAIEHLIVNRDERIRLGVEARKYVLTKFSPVEVAHRYLRLIEGDIPEDWWMNPRAFTYLEGWGQNVYRTQQNIRQMVAKSGIESLQLTHRPDLERLFLDFAGLADHE